MVLWADTIHNHFQSHIARAAVAVLEQAGFQVHVPRAHLCCGRPLYDSGQLEAARGLLRQAVDALGPQIDAGTPVVVLEPSCLSVFRDELVEMLPEDSRAAQLARLACTLGEFLTTHAEDYRPPLLTGTALFHAHCHQKSVLSVEPDISLLRTSGLQVETPDSGCCGMAGGFGFYRDRYDVSVAVGERVLLPAVRESDQQKLIVSDGFSCREQIRQCTDRQAVHLAEVLAPPSSE